MYEAHENRYEEMTYTKCGASGLRLPAMSLGLWHNFGSIDNKENMKKLIFSAFDHGITHFDLANNYGPVYGSAEANLGEILKTDMKPYRNELIIATKAGYDMWPGPYGDGGSRKYLISSLDDSLMRLGLDYVDIFYFHCPDAETPPEETMMALDTIVRQGKALYVGISNHNREDTMRAHAILKDLKTPFIIHQTAYSLLNRYIEADNLREYLSANGVGCIAFSPLAQGLLTGKYLKDIPSDSRIGCGHSTFLTAKNLSNELNAKLASLAEIASGRGQTLAQMSLAWILRDGLVTSVLIGASKTEQIVENIKALENTKFSASELKQIDKVLK
jgi:L-glyceraldehyde 3-phosphate reductase